MPNIIESRAIIVENDTAPDDFLPHMKKFNKKQTRNMTNGYKVVVANEILFQCVPFKVLYNLPP